MSVVLPTPGPPVKTQKFGLWIKCCPPDKLRRAGNGGKQSGGDVRARPALVRRAALEVADLDGGDAGEVHRAGAGARIEVDALALDRAADIGGVPVAVVDGAVRHLQADGLLDEQHAALGD